MKAIRLLAFLSFFAIAFEGAELNAQTLSIRLMDGRSGKPVARSCINIWVGDHRKAALLIPTDEQGVATLHLTENENEVDTRNHAATCGVDGVNSPVFAYQDSIRINVGYVTCSAKHIKYSWLLLATFQTKQLLEDGFVSPNVCGHATATRKPGELVLFVRPLNLLEKFSQ